MKILYTFLLLIFTLAGFAQGYQNIINTVPAVNPGSIYGAKVISYLGDHRIAEFFPRAKRGAVKAGIDVVVTDINGNILLTKGIAMDSAVTILAGGGCKDGGYYIVAQHNDRSYTKFQTVFIKLDSLGQVLWNSAVEYGYANYTTPTKVIEDELGNFYINQNGYRVTSMISLRANGAYRWGTTFAYDSTATSCLYSMCLTGDSGLMCIGQNKYHKTLAVINYDGSIRWLKTYKTDSCYLQYKFIHKTPDGGYIAGGSYDFQYIYNPFQPFGSGLCKFDSYGNVEWESFFYDTGGCQTPSALDAVQNWDGRYSVIGISYGIVNFVFSRTGDLLGYLKSYPTHVKGTLHYVNDHIVKLTYSDLFSSILTSQDTMQCVLLESDHVLYTCNAGNSFQCLSLSVTDSNRHVATGGYTLIPNRIASFNFWPISTVNVSYSGSASVECTPPLHHHTSPADTTSIDTTTTAISVDQIALSGISIHPNPTSGKIILTLPDPGITGIVNLFDITGKSLETAPLNAITTELDMTAYSDGIYFIETENTATHAKATKKVVLQK